MVLHLVLYEVICFFDQVVLQTVVWIDRCYSDCQMTLWMVRWL